MLDILFSLSLSLSLSSFFTGNRTTVPSPDRGMALIKPSHAVILRDPCFKEQ